MHLSDETNVLPSSEKKILHHSTLISPKEFISLLSKSWNCL